MPLSSGDKLGPPPAALMDLKPGDKLGDRYQLISKLGSGGMGEVWKARDTELDRDVALKVSKSEFTARFKQEARAMAAFSHNNICQIHDVGPNYIVMELIDGVQLSGPLPVEKAVGYAGQILDALDAAHRKTFTHRDLKPANVMVTAKGVVKLLDFGLAKRNVRELGPEDVTGAALTKEGNITGTLQYMSPEQLNGKEADARSDIFAFGCVLYEMLSGRKAFSGSTTASVIAAILEREPEPLQTTSLLDRVIRTCLAKDPDERFQSARDTKKALMWAMEGATTAPSPSRLGMRMWMTTAVVMTLIAVTLGFVHFREKPPVVAAISSTILPPETTAFDFRGPNDLPALSPDGKWIVFGAHTADNKNPLWLRPLASTTGQWLAGTDGGTFPFWSPDSRYVAFFAGGKLKKIDISGGPALAIADASAGRGGSWSPEGIILFTPDSTTSALLKVASSGGTPTPATSLEPTKAYSHRFPWFLPDGRHFLFEEMLNNRIGDVGVRVGSLDSSETVLIGNANSNAVYSRGYLLFRRENTLMAQPFDAKNRIVQGEAVPVAEQISYALTNGPVGVFTVSVSGLLAFQAGGGSATGQTLTWFERGGKPAGMLGEPGGFQNVDLSPDRKRAAVSAADSTGNMNIWIYDISRGLRTRFTFDAGLDRQPLWSPDGSTIVWDRQKGGGRLYRKAADGKGTEDLLYEGVGVNEPTSWSPDGKFLLFNKGTPNLRGGVWMLPLSSGTAGSPLKASPLVDTAFNELNGVFSPDGRWVAYESDESQQYEVYVVPFPGPGGKHQISIAGGRYPRWRPDGKEIFYAGPDEKLMAAEVILKVGGIEVGAVHPLGISVAFRASPYDVSLDGQRILAVTEPERSASPLTLVENWTALLKK